MTNGRFRRLVAGVGGTALFVLAIFVGSASPAGAAPVTPTGKCGAANMSNAGDAMADAMKFHTDDHGDDGMRRAVALTACS